MTKIEKRKCEKLMYKAIAEAKNADAEFKQAKISKRNGDIVSFETNLSKANQYYGEACGICQVLSTLNFKHEDMKILHDLTY